MLDTIMCYFMDRDIVVQKGIDRCIDELPDFCKQFLTYCNLKLSKLTTRSYLYVVRMFFHHYAMERGIAYSVITLKDLDAITHTDVEGWLDTFKGKIETNTTIYRHSVMKTFLGYFYTRREIQWNVAEQIIMPKLEEKPIKKLSPKQVDDLLAAVDNYEIRIKKNKLRDKTIIVFFLESGVRISELIGLDVKHIDMKDGSYTVRRKGGKTETLYMTEGLYIQLMYYMESIDTSDPNKPLFPSRDTPRLADNTVRDMVEKYMALAGIQGNISPHKLRKTFGTTLYKKTRDIFAVAKILGHTSVNTTRKFYADIDEDIKRDAIRGFSYKKIA